ncbi:MAG: S46 family peptidase [Candidatus Zixiibacteriota bacterium]
MTSGKWIAVLTVVVVFTAARVVVGEEGMWPHYDVDKMPFESFRSSGLELNPADIYNPDGGGLCEAVVRLGATGSFVSADGLILTNHHVAFDAVQKQSTVVKNLVRDGFYAATRGEEIPAIGYDAWVTKSAIDVTERVLARVTDGMTDFERYQAIDRAIKEIIAEGEKQGDVKCRVAKMFDGKQFILYTRLQIRDVRIVYVPPLSIGEYGGDIDNWMWPRHTGDFSFLRAYVAPDGSVAEYSEENVVYHPKVFFPIAKSGIEEGDFTMIIGFPGKTNRYACSYEVDDIVHFSYPSRIELYRDILGIIEDISRDDPETAIRLASTVKGINNGLKNRIGMLEGFDQWDLLERKVESEIALTDFINSSPELRTKYGGVLPGLDSLYREISRTRDKDFVMGSMMWSDYVDIAFTLYKWSVERQKDDMERESGYQDRDSTSIREWLEDLQVNLVPKYERALVGYFLDRALNLPEGQRVSTIDEVIRQVEGTDPQTKLETWLDYAFANTKVGDLGWRLKMFHMSTKELESLNDPMIEFARVTYPEREEHSDRAKRHAGTATRLQPQLINAYAEFNHNEMYPDANGTMRVNFGVVRGYSPSDAVWYKCFTTAKGVIEKETGEDPFIVPEALEEYHANASISAYADPAIGDVPVNFLSTNDATGGNSGSPVIDGKGRLVGVLFDCNYESIAADYLFNPSVTRSISVDTRYVLHIIDEIYHLDALVGELTLQ